MRYYGSNKGDLLMKKISQAKELKAYKAAKTPKEMVESWGLIQGGDAEEFHDLYRVFEEKAPHLNIIKTFIQDPEIKMMERGILNPKAKELTRLALALDSANTVRITSQVVAAKTRGATDEEIMDTVYLAVYSVRKNAVAKLGPALREGFKIADEKKITEKMEAVRKKGKEFLIDRAKEVAAFKNAKNPGEMVTTWSLKLGGDMKQGIEDWKKGSGPLTALKLWEERAPELNIVKDLWHDPEWKWMERELEGHAVDYRTQEYIWWALITRAHNAEAVTFHVATNLCRGMSEDETMELLYLLNTEVAKAFLDKVGPALAEGFKRAEELGF
jgi:alkylhydroperoxidase/carboxymuconolactone decarboxylase family protein YurZ